MIKHIEQTTTTTTVASAKFEFLLIITLSLAMSLIMMISILLLINRPAASSSETVLPLSSETIEQLPISKNVLNIPSNQLNSSSKLMKIYMRSIYNAMYRPKRRKRQSYLLHSSFTLSDDIDSIVSLFNQNNESTYSFNYHASLEHLIDIELVLPIQRLTKFAMVQIAFNGFNLLFKQPFQMEANFIKINLTKYIQTFPVTLFIELHGISLHSSGVLTLYFQRLIPQKTRIRRDLSLLDDENQLITHPNDPLSCQVRPYRTTFAELNWTSWILEPNSYEMNICSGICHTNSNLSSYLIMQNLLRQMSPKKIPPLCCKPKRFSSTILLYYDGANLILKRHEKMRVVECGCS